MRARTNSDAAIGAVYILLSITLQFVYKMLTQLAVLLQAMFGGNIDGPDVVRVSSSVKLRGVGDDLLLGGPCATLLASADSVHIDFDKMSTNAGMASPSLA